jgi:hypothetical protein
MELLLLCVASLLLGVVCGALCAVVLTLWKRRK